MLILTRTPNPTKNADKDTFYIGSPDDPYMIEIKVMESDYNSTIRVGINAPDEMNIVRKELTARATR